ncbi:hypothetical protein SAY86_016675 [Trapa natans]|uniref:Uncharacterized protein n=1 Tax=Trapa natans TaxID=22666 RepID=A0AAN7LGG6_TRANT|nr:hypothetical protein SAY86_016675 [Trapa natans]
MDPPHIFLWDYDARNMSYLRLPKRAPEYRMIPTLHRPPNPIGSIGEVSEIRSPFKSDLNARSVGNLSGDSRSVLRFSHRCVLRRPLPAYSPLSLPRDRLIG